MWSGVEPEPGVFNETYIKVMSDMLDNLEAHGMAAIIDVHQDVLSSYFCEYDGAPTWLVDLSTSSKKEFPWPLKWDGVEPCPYSRQWGLNYLAESTGAAFQDIYDNVNGMRDHFGKFWAKVASSFKGKKILGYEIINEPWAGNIYDKPSLLLPGVAGSTNLQPLYDAISENIRDEDPEHIIFYEPVTWGMIFNGTVTGSGFTHVPGGASHADKSVLSFHYYCWWYTPDGNFTKLTCDNLFIPKIFNQVKEDVRIMGGAVMMTEWGLGCDPTYGITEQCNPIMDQADESLVSWTDWWWTGPLMNNWNSNPESIKIYSRTYAQSVAGKPTKMKFDADSDNKLFTLCYDVNPSISQPTEIFANFDIHYPNGVLVQLSGSAAESMSVEVQHSRILVFYQPKKTSGDRVNTDMDVCVRVISKI